MLSWNNKNLKWTFPACRFSADTRCLVMVYPEVIGLGCWRVMALVYREVRGLVGWGVDGSGWRCIERSGGWWVGMSGDQFVAAPRGLELRNGDGQGSPQMKKQTHVWAETYESWATCKVETHISPLRAEASTSAHSFTFRDDTNSWSADRKLQLNFTH